MRVCVELAQELLEVRGSAARDERCSPPVVQKCSGDIVAGRGCQLLNEQISLAEAVFRRRR